ncbi:MAG: HDIG domain-containing metalloprotein [Planctomycetota bacterium]|jgi:putative nucleotidyltransferase with HDIG domain
MTREEAVALVETSLSEENLRKHVLAVEAVMRALARRLGGDEDSWGLAGLLHDIDYEETKDDPDRHAVVGAERLRALGVADEVVEAVLAHNDKAPRARPIASALTCADPVTGFIIAVTLVRPDKKLASVKLKSVKKRWKEKRFAAGASREGMAVCSELGLERDEFLGVALEAMQGIAPRLGL